MLGETDLTDIEELERLRRSIAMLPAATGQKIFSREEALRLLQVHIASIRAIAID